MSSRFDRIPECDRQTDGQISYIKVVHVTRDYCHPKHMGVYFATKHLQQFPRCFWFGELYCYFRFPIVIAIIWGHFFLTRHGPNP